MAKEPAKKAEIGEMHPDAWDRFRQAVHVMAKAGPQHRIGSGAVKSGPQRKRGATDSSLITRIAPYPYEGSRRRCAATCRQFGRSLDASGRCSRV